MRLIGQNRGGGVRTAKLSPGVHRKRLFRVRRFRSLRCYGGSFASLDKPAMKLAFVDPPRGSVHQLLIAYGRCAFVVHSPVQPPTSSPLAFLGDDFICERIESGALAEFGLFADRQHGKPQTKAVGGSRCLGLPVRSMPCKGLFEFVAIAPMRGSCPQSSVLIIFYQPRAMAVGTRVRS